MENVVLVIHLLIAVALVGLILLQRSEGGGLVGGGGNMGAVAPRAQTDTLTRMTGFLAGCFIVTSLLLVILANNRTGDSIVDQMASETPPAAETPADTPVESPVSPTVPAVPLVQ